MAGITGLPTGASMADVLAFIGFGGYIVAALVYLAYTMEDKQQ